MMAGAGVFSTLQPAAVLPGYAAWPVIDYANLSRNTVTSIQMVQDVIHQVTQIQNQLNQYMAQLQSLQSLDQLTFRQVKVLIQANTDELNRVLNDMDAIGYSLNQIKTQYHDLFPQDNDFSGVDLAGYEEYYREWNKELNESARTAMESQAVIERSKQYNQEAAEILARSTGAEGEVRQLQAQNQMLGMMSSQIGDLTQILATSGRVAATAAARSAAEKAVDQELNRRSSEGYNDWESPGPVADNMPSLQR